MSTAGGQFPRPRRGWWHSAWPGRILKVIKTQLQQGTSPQKIALTLAVGVALGLFPIFGTTSALCLVFGLWLKLNQPIVQLVNWFAAPLQLPCIYIFVRIGEWLTRSPPLHFSIADLFVQFKDSPLRFFQKFGVTSLQGILAWALIAPATATLIYFLLLTPLRKLGQLRNTGATDVE